MSAHYEVIDDLLRRGRLRLALSEVDRLLAVAPDDGTLLAQKADVLVRLSRVTDARDYLSQALAAEPEVSFVHYLCGRVFRTMGCEAEALATLDESIRLDPEFGGPYLDKASIFYERALLVRSCNKAGMLPTQFPRRTPPLRSGEKESREALLLARQAIALAPNESECHRILALILLDLGDANGALEAAQVSLQLNPEVAATHEVAGDAYLKAGQHETALGHFIEAKRLEPSNDAVRQKVVNAFSHFNWPYRFRTKLIDWMLSFTKMFSPIFDRPGGPAMSAMAVLGLLALMAMLEKFGIVTSWTWISMLFVFAIVPPLLLGALATVAISFLSRYALQFTPATCRWLSPKEIWASNILLVMVIAGVVAIVLFATAGREHFFDVVIVGFFTFAAANPIGIYMANRLSSRRFRTARFALPFAAASLILPVLLLTFEPFPGNRDDMNFSAANIWFLVGLGLFWEDVCELSGNRKG